MGFQEIIVLIIVLTAVGYGGLIFYRRTRSFLPKSGCANDCGCSPDSGTPHTAD